LELVNSKAHNPSPCIFGHFLTFPVIGYGIFFKRSACGWYIVFQYVLNMYIFRCLLDNFAEATAGQDAIDNRNRILRISLPIAKLSYYELSNIKIRAWSPRQKLIIQCVRVPPCLSTYSVISIVSKSVFSNKLYVTVGH